MAFLVPVVKPEYKDFLSSSPSKSIGYMSERKPKSNGVAIPANRLKATAASSSGQYSSSLSSELKISQMRRSSGTQSASSSERLEVIRMMRFEDKPSCSSAPRLGQQPQKSTPEKSEKKSSVWSLNVFRHRKGSLSSKTVH